MDKPPSRSLGSSASSERRQRVVPLSFQFFGMALNLLSRINNEWASGVLSGLWFSVFKSRQKPWVAEFWAGADESIEIEVDGQPIPVYCWGEGPLVVSMHGWSGSGTQFRLFVPVLVEAGFRVACFDAPSHGANPGRKAHLIQFCESLYAIQDRLGPIECVIAHSLGAMATVYASQHRLSVRRLVLVAPHLDVQQMFETFRDLLGMRAALGQRFHDKIGARMRTILDQQDPWATLNPQAMLCDAGYPGLLVYDRQDPEVSQAQFDSISQCWQAARVLTTDGLGHNRILKDAQVIRAIRDYLKS